MNFIASFILLFSFLISDTYSWEDGGTTLGSYGNLSDVANVGPTNGITPYDGDYMLTVSESPIDGTPQAWIAWVTDISAGDEITACFYGYDDTPNASSSMRVWGNWTANNDITSYAGSADGNEDYTAGTGWDQICHTFSTSQAQWEAGEALLIQARLYSSSSASAPVQYYVDLASVETASTTATINFPGAQEPIEGPIANAGEDQTIDAGTIVMLDGSGSYHTDGEITEYYWEQLSGPSILLSDEESVMPTFTAPNETTTLSFDLSITDTEGLQSSDTVVINVIASAGTLTIAEIQGQSDASPYENQFVTTSGTVMAKNANGFFIQDAAAGWSGIWVLDFGSANTSVGDEIEVSGQVIEYFDLTELDISDGSSNILSSGNTLFNPVVISSPSEEFESVLVKVSGVCDVLPNEYGEWTLSGTTIDDYFYGENWDNGSFMPMIGNEYTITGPLNYAYSTFRVNPRNADDIEDGILSSSNVIENFSILEAYPNPFNPTLTIEFSTLNTELIEVSIYNIMGHKVENLFSGIVESNQLQTLNWDASNYSSGDYLVQLKSENQFKTHKITLIK
ncbi:T9SS type A sorting domain-containing protein [Candidatus Marinimicrobia bacterium]|nr:T9SS type A sorting domain-containing protein [Candidatus Neomarinimicrobiota bacterium]